MADPGKYLIGESLREKLKSTIAKVESIPFGGPVSRIPTIIEGDGGGANPKVFRVCTASGAWPEGSSKSVTYYGVTSTPNTVSVINKIVSLPAPRSTNTTRIVNIAKDGTQWYLVSFQMSSKTAIMATSTQTITFMKTATTQTITFISAVDTKTLSYASAGPDKTLTYVTSVSEVDLITGISATLNTTNCNISITTTKTKIKTAGDTQTTTFKTAGSSQTATIVSLGTSQTAAILIDGSTQTATITTGTFTATYVSLEL
jgi:hypothetical protein